MLASHRWLMELSGLDLSPDEVAERLTMAGLEVEGSTRAGDGLLDVVIAEVRERKPHPKRDKLTLVSVTDGTSTFDVVCGASNVPDVGGRVVLARPGAKLPNGMEITPRVVGGVQSHGMLASEVELDIGSDEDGILVLGADDGALGALLVDAFDLRDTVHELSITPNRGDCLGHLGVARELCALLDRPFAWPAPNAVDRLAAPKELFAQGDATFVLPLGEGGAGEVQFRAVRVDIAAPTRCARYGAALVQGVDGRPSSLRLRHRLHRLGLRAISGVVDATNLILLGFGHPIHAFDYDRLRGGRIEVRLARQGERMRTLDGQEHVLTTDDLLICDAEGPVALAGVMGGEGSEISPQTQRVLIECAYFDPRSVRRTSKRTGLHTDSSHRFERGVDPGAVRSVLAHSAAMVADMGGGVAIEQALDVVATPVSRKRIALRAARVAALLGTSIDGRAIASSLQRLGCELSATQDGWQVDAPTHRPDFAAEIDLVEEIARLHGYDALPTELAPVRPSVDGTPRAIGQMRRLREAAAAAGLDEAISYGFLAPGDLAAARVPAPVVRLANPMSEERSVMRTSLLPGLAASLRRAQSQQLDRFAQFELGRIYVGPAEQGLPNERHQLALMLWGERRSWYADGEAMDFYDAKAALAAIVGSLAGGVVQTQRDDALGETAPYLHPRRRARVMLDDSEFGHVGELHPEVVEALGLIGRPVFANLDVDAVLDASAARATARAIALLRFPSASRDLAVVVDEDVEAGPVAAQLREVGGALVEAVRVFDVYRGEPVPAGRKSLAFHIVYRDPDATLTDDAIDAVHARITQHAETKFGAAVRR